MGPIDAEKLLEVPPFVIAEVWYRQPGISDVNLGRHDIDGPGERTGQIQINE
jgi:hypothetical protein